MKGSVYSEADFSTFNLAWGIHKMHPDFNVRLEKERKCFHFLGNDKICVLELKYKGKRFDITVSRLSLKKSKCPRGTIFL